MGTPYENIIELALTSIQDFKLDKLYQHSYELWMEHLTRFMIRGLSSFTNCKQDLTLRNDEAQEFEIDLTLLEQSIIADYTVIAWANKEIHDVRQITGMMQNAREAKRHSEANLLKEKINMANAIKEDVDRKQVSYDLQNIKGWS